MLYRITSLFGNMLTNLKHWVLENAVNSLVLLYIIVLYLNPQGYDVHASQWTISNILLLSISHQGLGHLLSNSLVLLLVWPLVQRKFGLLFCVLTYLTGAYASALTFFWLHPDSALVGASGAISTFIAIIPLCAASIFELLTFLLVSLGFLVLNCISYIPVLEGYPMGGVAHVAHIAGYMWGLILVFFAKWGLLRLDPTPIGGLSENAKGE